jgi:molybdate transport system ATP-binding protein
VTGLAVRVRRHLVDVDVTLPLDPAAPVTVLFGPSGAGKTTLLRCLAGLDRPESGRVALDGEVWDDGRVHVAAKDRRVGYLFQEAALFPHLTVAANVAYGLGRLPRGERGPRVAEALASAGVGHLASRSARVLSGGEAQRVALARALAPRPRLLLLDEPLAGLDTPARLRLRAELRTVLAREAVPTVLVTHDRAEALALGDRVAVLVDGRLHQLGPVEDVFNRPADEAVAAAVGVDSVLAGVVVAADEALVSVRVGERELAALPPSTGVPEAGRAVRVFLRAEDVILELPGGAASPGSARNRLPGVVTAVTPEGPLLRVDLDCGFPLAALVTRAAGVDLGLRPGVAVVAALKAPSVHLVLR